MRRQAAHFFLDPGFRPVVDGLLAESGGVEGGTDAYGHRTGFLEKSLARPKLTGVVGDGHHLAADMAGEVRATDLVTSLLPGATRVPSGKTMT